MNDSQEIQTQMPGRNPRKVALARRMAEIARPAVLRLPPFDVIKEESCLERYQKFLDKRPPDKRARLVEAFISTMEFHIGGEACRNREEMAVWEEISEEARHYYMDKQPRIILRPSQVSNADAKKIIVEEFKRSLPEFKKGKDPVRGIFRLAKPNAHVEGICVDFDFGTWGPGHFTPHLGTINPYLRPEMSAMACIRQRTWKFETAAECSRAVQEVISYVQILVPLVEQKVA